MGIETLGTVLRILGLLCLGVLFFVAVLATARSLRLVGVLLLSPVENTVDVSGRYGSVRGRLASENPLVGPLSGEPCVAYELEERAIEEDPTGTFSVAERETIGVVTRFRVVDVTGSISVEPTGTALSWAGEGAHVASPDAFESAPTEETTLTVGEGESPPERVAEASGAVARFGSRHADRFEYRERRVPVDATAVVTGRYVDGVLRAGRPFRIDTDSPRVAARAELPITVTLSAIAAVLGILLAFGVQIWLL